MGQRCVHYTERDNGTRVLYAPNQWLLVISMSTRSHDKTVETADNPVYDVLFFFFFLFFFFVFFFFLFVCFVNGFFCVFSREFQHNSIKSVQCVPLDVFSKRPP